jgi:hypothetical protein
MVTAAFELLSDMDTIYISGKAPYGLLILPQPPTDSSVLYGLYKVFREKPDCIRARTAYAGMVLKSMSLSIQSLTYQKEL